ncbi:MAG: hypothetical protein ACI8RZ_006900 [Myxococcota bacterium]|jgi:hypothetical protein
MRSLTLLAIMMITTAAATPGEGWAKVGRVGVAAAPAGAVLAVIGGVVSFANVSDGGGGEDLEGNRSNGRALGEALMGVGGVTFALSAPTAAIGRRMYGEQLGVNTKPGRWATRLSLGGLTLVGTGVAMGGYWGVAPTLSTGLVTLGTSAWLASWPAVFSQRQENERHAVVLSPMLSAGGQGLVLSSAF